MDPRAACLDPEKFWDQVLVVGSGCWLWDGFVNPNGYGQRTVRVQGRNRTIQAHRLAYELFVGPVPIGLELDHLCRTRSCVRPDHLEAVSHAENVRRGESAAASTAAAAARTHCRRGHALRSDNVRVHRGADGYERRYCLACARVRKQEYEARQRDLRRKARLEANWAAVA